jgi:hypothetical protein
MRHSGLKRTNDGRAAATKEPASPHFGAKTSDVTSGVGPSLIPQAHGGALLAGGLSGHKGAGGRPRNEVRELTLAGYFENLPRLIRIAAGTELRKVLNAQGELVEVQPTFKESIEAMKELGNRGIGNRLELDPSAVGGINLSVMIGPALLAEQPNLAQRVEHHPQ